MGTRFLTPLLLVLLALGACGQSSQATSERREPTGGGAERPVIRITTAVAEGRAVQRSVETVGSLLAWEEVVAKSQATGTLLRLYADLGDRVSAGQLLAELDRREADLGLDQLQADLLAGRENLARARATAEASRANLQRTRESRRALVADVDRARADAQWKRLELDRNRELAAKQLIAARDVDQAQAQYAMAQAQLQSAETALNQHTDQVQVAEAQLQADLGAVKAAEAQVRQREAALELGRKRVGDTTVVAPMGGFVARRHASVGEFVKDSTAIFTLVATDPLKYTGTIPERFAPEVRIGQDVRLQVEAYPDRTFSGRVTRISPAVEVQTRTLALEARVPNGPGFLRPGFFARGGVLTRQEARVPFVPAEAVVYAVGLTKVFVVANGKAQERQVKAGLREAGRVEILEGVKPGETVATSSLAQLYDGAPVAVAPPTPRPASPPPAATR
ncbi:MAG TPA: efflux RND transporter periplasmic adaptor subunit [Methylomirabilota bacterium]|jgi:RND family efflux transporter MFP subunit|nr:efflux RND transporter periplasmic adaptor subunit [Methylomirabilota bacterium]